MKRMLLPSILSLALYSNFVFTESFGKGVSECETLFNYFDMCFKSGLKASHLNQYSTQDAEYCALEAGFVFQTTTKQSRKDIKKAMALYSKGLDDFYNSERKRDPEKVKLYGKEMHDFEKWCVIYCADGITGHKGTEFIPYSEFVHNCPENAKSRK